MNRDLIVDARGIHAWYGSSHVLHGAQLQIARGQTVGLLGRNGMGKSTLIRTLLGHVAQRDGHITLFGKDASRFKPHEVARLGVAYVPEGRGVFPNLPTGNMFHNGLPGQVEQSVEPVLCQHEKFGSVPPIRKFAKYIEEDQNSVFKLWMTGPMKPITKYGGLPKPTGCV